jgi:hypothetical protein
LNISFEKLVSLLATYAHRRVKAFSMMNWLQRADMLRLRDAYETSEATNASLLSCCDFLGSLKSYSGF